MLPNRIATYLTAGAALAGALAPAAADLDTASTVGVLTGVSAVVLIFREWLKGWRGHEWREAAAEAGAAGLPLPPDHPEA